MIRHDYTSLLFHASSEKSRFLRWMDLYNSILNGLFISTLFFGTFYANTGECETYLTEVDCLNPMNSITGDTQCLWSPEEESCSLNEPPSNISFTVILALTCTLIGVPLQIGISFIIDEYCSKRPRLEDIGLSTEYWLGVGIRTVPLEISNSFEPFHEIERTSFLQRRLAKLKAENRENGGSSTNVDPSPQSVTDNPALVMQKSYENLMTVEEEFAVLINAVQSFYKVQKSVVYKTLIANLNSIDLQAWQEITESRAFEIKKWLGLQPNLEFLPIPIYEKIFFYRSRQEKVLKAIQRTRNNVAELSDQLEELSSLNQPTFEEVLILNTFVLEQFPIFKRWILKDQLLCFEGFFPSVIDFYSWFIAWIFVISVYLFYCYWIFAWGVSNGNMLLSAWGLNFAIGTIQDIFFVQIAKIALIYFIAFFSIKPKLVEIRHILIDTARMLIQQKNTNNNDSKIDENFQRTLKEQELKDYGISYDDYDENNNSFDADISPIVSFSNPGMSFRKSIISSMSSIFGVQQLSMIHTFSSACVISWKNRFKHLFISRVLQQLDDYDAVRLRKETISFKSDTVLTYFIIFVPLAITFFGITMAQVLFDTIFPLFSTGIILAGYYLSTISADYVIIVCFVIVGALFWHLKVAKLAIKLDLKSKAKKKTEKQQFIPSKTLLLSRGKNSFQRSIKMNELAEKKQQEPQKPKNQRIPRPVISFIFTVLYDRVLKQLIVQLITRGSFWRYYKVLKEKRAFEERLIWKNINLPLEYQGKRLHPLSSSTSSSPVKHDFNSVTSRFNFVDSDDDDDYDDDSSIPADKPSSGLVTRMSLRNLPVVQSFSSVRTRKRKPQKRSDRTNHLSYDSHFVKQLNDARNEINQLYELLQRDSSLDNNLEKSRSVEFDDFDNPRFNSFYEKTNCLIRLESLPAAIVQLQNQGILDHERKKYSFWKDNLLRLLRSCFIQENNVRMTSLPPSFLQNYLNAVLFHVIDERRIDYYVHSTHEQQQQQQHQPQNKQQTKKLFPFQYRLQLFYEQYQHPTPAEQFKEHQRRLSMRFSQIEDFFYFFLLLSLIDEYEEREVSISFQELSELVALIILGNYRWLITKERLIKVFTRWPEYLQNVQQSTEDNKKNKNMKTKQSIWDSFYPILLFANNNNTNHHNGSIRLNEEQLEEIFSSFDQWIASVFPVHSHKHPHKSLISDQLEIIPFFLFKEWLTNSLTIFLKIQHSIHYS